MRRTNKLIKAKEPVRLRYKKLNNGNMSIYLDSYVQGVRKYEFLKMYLVPERDSISKYQNRNVLAAANAIKAQRIIEISNNAAGIRTNKARSKVLFHNWICAHYQKTENSVTPSTRRARECTRKHLEKYGDMVPLRNIDKDYCLGFVEYLQSHHRKHKNGTEKQLSKTSVCTYIKHFVALLNVAVRDELLPSNPFYKIDRMERPKPEESKRAFLTIEEIKRLMVTPSPREDVKQLFLLSCFCGLRWSDVSTLHWSNLESNNGKLYINTVMQKTQKSIYIPLSDAASGFLPTRGENEPDSAPIFSHIPTALTVKRNLEKWAAAAGIAKKVTFHVSRHTFATTSLTLGADLFTTSKLMGHANVTTTQIYARIINQKKDETVALFDKHFL